MTRSIGRTLMLVTLFVAFVFSAGPVFAADSIKGMVALRRRADCEVDRNPVGSQRRRTRNSSIKRSRATMAASRFAPRARMATACSTSWPPAACRRPPRRAARIRRSFFSRCWGASPREQVVVNEFTTVASAFTAARFIRGESISGNPLGLRIAAMNVPNLVNLQSGGWGSVIIDGLNLTRSTTLANFNTLASLITYARHVCQR